MSGATQDGEQPEAAPPDPYLLWLIAPSPDGNHAAVEFAEADAATFVYKTNGDFDSFAKSLNRALEAISFKREVIRLSDSELLKPENADYLMADERTAALRYIRKHFTGRIIHSSAEAWKRKLLELWNGAETDPAKTAPAQAGAKFCGECGANLAPGMKFCTKCGKRL